MFQTISSGNGFVGQGMVKQALQRGLDVISINRSGSPREFIPPNDPAGTVEWVRGDVFHPEDWREVLEGAEGAISCIGAFGSNEVSATCFYHILQLQSYLLLCL